ncbi:MAG TPA: DUF6496 domain-containing protein [Myxococcota bacterium]|nr:DUF6496 domain-containing protein [Myxococcota bacterium]
MRGRGLARAEARAISARLRLPARRTAASLRVGRLALLHLPIDGHVVVAVDLLAETRVREVGPVVLVEAGRLLELLARDVERETKRGRLRSGRSGQKVKNRKQAIAIGLSEARREGGKAPSRGRRSAKGRRRAPSSRRRARSSNRRSHGGRRRSSSRSSRSR